MSVKIRALQAKKAAQIRVADLFRLTKAMPDQTDMPDIVLELNKVADLTEAEGDWKDLNRKLVERAWIVPYGHRKLATFVSERMDFENCTRFHPVYFNDYSSFCLK